MWNVNPEFLCRKHLLGEHVECHMLVGTLNRNKSIKGFIDKGLIEVHNVKKRHDELVKEMSSRGMNHKSDLPEFKSFTLGSVDVDGNVKELMRRCPACKERISNAIHQT